MAADDFRAALDRWLADAQGRKHKFADVTSGNLHREVGEYPGGSHRMPICCGVMRAAMGPDDEVLQEPKKGQGASLTIRYALPR